MVSAHGGFAVDRRDGKGETYFALPGAGLLRLSAGDATLRVDGEDLAPAARRLRVGFASPDLAFYDEMSAEEKHGLPPKGTGLSHRACAFLKLAQACLR